MSGNFIDKDENGNSFQFSPSGFIMLMDSVLFRPGTTNHGIQVNNVPLLGNGGYGNKYQIHTRHSQSANVWCADGSAKSLKAGELRDTYRVNQNVICRVFL
jgi:hypothetical protein